MLSVHSEFIKLFTPFSPTVEYKDWKKDPDNFLWVKVDTKGLKKKMFKDVASNADIQFDPADR